MNKHLEKVLEKFQEKNPNAQIEYATEHGNDDKYFLIFSSSDEMEAFQNECRNYINEPHSYDYQLEQEFDMECVYDDEYTTCSDCYHVIRTSPTHYGWQPDFYVGDGFIVCNECFNSNEDYQEAYVSEKINNYKTAINGLVSDEQLEALGFEKLNEDSYENGLHDGQNDSPESIYNDLSEEYDEILFSIDSVGQFDVNFDVWVRGEI